jgi:sugar lactone lactonase YvrE
VDWVNGIATGPDGALYVTDNDAILKIDRAGNVSTVLAGIRLNDCVNVLPETPGLPYLRGLAVAGDGTIYAAANGCRTVVSVPVKGAPRTILAAEPPWSPTGVALAGSDIYVLEYLHTRDGDRRDWVPRIRRVDKDGKVSTILTIDRKNR